MPPRRAKSKLPMILSVAVVAVIGAAILMAVLRNNQAHDQADQATYGATGTPCPTTTRAELASLGPALAHHFEYDDLQLQHAFGEADCAEIAGKGGFMGIGAPHLPICRFSGPGSLEVRDGQTDLLFRPGIGKPAAILKEDGQVKCVMTATALG
jgi:hypothetical protein